MEKDTQPRYWPRWKNAAKWTTSTKCCYMTIASLAKSPRYTPKCTSRQFVRRSPGRKCRCRKRYGLRVYRTLTRYLIELCRSASCKIEMRELLRVIQGVQRRRPQSFRAESYTRGPRCACSRSSRVSTARSRRTACCHRLIWRPGIREYRGWARFLTQTYPYSSSTVAACRTLKLKRRWRRRHPILIARLWMSLVWNRRWIRRRLLGSRIAGYRLMWDNPEREIPPSSRLNSPPGLKLPRGARRMAKRGWLGASGMSIFEGGGLGWVLNQVHYPTSFFFQNIFISNKIHNYILIKSFFYPNYFFDQLNIGK